MKTMFKNLVFLVKSIYAINYDKEYRKFNCQFYNMDYDKFTQDGERVFTKKELFYLEVIEYMSKQPNC